MYIKTGVTFAGRFVTMRRMKLDFKSTWLSSHLRAEKYPEPRLSLHVPLCWHERYVISNG